MNVLSDVLKELFGMFVADVRLTIAVLALVAVIAGGIRAFPGMDPSVFGFALLGGCLVIVFAVTTIHARRVKNSTKG